ncbi:MAG: S-methyl-5-thioribose-1-phosphate isomerase [Bacillota bacterium]
MEALIWDGAKLMLLDQTLLPFREEYIPCSNHNDVAEAILSMRVRGAPAIGVAAAYGMVLGASDLDGIVSEQQIQLLEDRARCLQQTRPTAVNLFWAVSRMLEKARQLQGMSATELFRVLEAEANTIFREDVEMNRRIGAYGNTLIPEGANILTHCNAGALATAGYGTALGVIRSAHAGGKNIHVYADETRPLLQGARLTAWELMRDGIPVTLITDNMAGYLMQQGKIDLAVVGADRITANGDVANKIGTYTVAVLARAHNIPFYVAAPMSTIDLSLAGGELIPIEERHQDEVRAVFGHPVAPGEVNVFNPAFDVTPARLVTAIITDQGIIRPPYLDQLRSLEIGG